MPSPDAPDPAARPRRCPCGSGEILAQCCGPVLAGERAAPTAEALMRSRFTAFALGDVEHLLASWHPRTRPGREELAASLDPALRWLRLEIRETAQGGPFSDAGEVAFTAHHRREGQRGHLTERSRFARVDGAWMYVDGDVGA